MSRPLFIENAELLKGYQELLEQLYASDGDFDASVEEAAQELERISSVEVMADLDEALPQPKIDSFAAQTVIVFHSESVVERKKA